MKYRPEIDGLRGLAVAAVILYHAGFEQFSGGFIGVDVFFAISGYLIASIILNDLEQNRFRLAEFYERRARRLLPALYLVLFACWPLAWFLMLPTQLEDFSKSAIATSLFASNLLYWRESNYFNQSSNENPLIHTWSLAVEEQFYILFPIFLILIMTVGRRKALYSILFIALISLLISEWGWRNKSTANFYLPATRAWELLAGAAAAFVSQRRTINGNELLSMTGLAAILWSIFTFNESTPVPSLYAIVPIGGVLLFTLFTNENTVIGKMFSARLLVGLGLISYSAYLWHQPLFAFARIKTSEELSLISIVLLTLASLVFAWITWLTVEQPLRKRENFSRKQIWLFSVALPIPIIATGLTILANNGFDSRLSEQQQKILSWLSYSRQTPYLENKCFLRPHQKSEDFSAICTEAESNVLIWGDSHAAALASGWRNVTSVHQLTASGCPPLLNTWLPGRPHCGSLNEYVFDRIRRSTYTRVILHANWTSYGKTKIQSLENTLRSLKRIGVAEVIVIGGVPQYFPSLPERMLAKGDRLNMPFTVPYRQKRVADIDSALERIASNQSAKFIRPLDELCTRTYCTAAIWKDNQIVPMAWDYGHLTQSGAIFLATKMTETLDGLAN